MSHRRAVIQPPSIGRALGDHEERVSDLERAAAFAANLGVQYVYLASRSTITLPDTNAAVAFDFQGGVSSLGADALTDTPEVFETAVMSSGVYAGKHGLQINEPGVYLPFSSIIVNSELTLATQQSQHMSYDVESGSFSQSSWVFSGNFDHSYYGNQSVLELWAIGADTPCLIGLSASNGRGGGTGDVIAEGFLVVLRLGDQDMNAFPVLF